MILAEAEETYIQLMTNWILNHNNTEVDFTQPYVRRSLKYVYPMFMFLYAIVAVVGIVGNISIVVVMARRKLYHDQTFFFLGNLAFADIIKCVIVLPMSLANLLIQNWIFGSFMCFFLPMMQSFPLHASMLTFLMIAIDRYRLIVNPFRSRVPAGLCTIAVWVAAVCVVLPYAVYIKYIDIGAILGEPFTGVGICYVNVETHSEEYIRAVFVTMYALPLAIIGFLYVKVSAELKSQDAAATVSVHYATQAEDVIRNVSCNPYPAHVTWSTNESERRVDPEGASGESAQMKSYNERTTQDSDDDLDLVKEKRTQTYMIVMVTLFAMCWCPLNILILVNYFVHENDDNKGHYDIIYLTFLWFGFLSSCTNPILFASWRMSDTTKDRLRGYFRFSNRRRSSAHSQGSRSTEIYAPTHTPSPNEAQSSPKEYV